MSITIDASHSGSQINADIFERHPIVDVFFVASTYDGTFWCALAFRQRQGLRNDSQTAVDLNNQSCATPLIVCP
jgi:hypothetical protein